MKNDAPEFWEAVAFKRRSSHLQKKNDALVVEVASLRAELAALREKAG